VIKARSPGHVETIECEQYVALCQAVNSLTALFNVQDHLSFPKPGRPLEKVRKNIFTTLSGLFTPVLNESKAEKVNLLNLLAFPSCGSKIAN
jgi:hypothetical protein